MKSTLSTLFVALVAGQSTQECVVDITKTVGHITSAGLSIASAVADCATGSGAECSADITSAATALTAASLTIEQAVGDCGGDDPYCA